MFLKMSKETILPSGLYLPGRDLAATSTGRSVPLTPPVAQSNEKGSKGCSHGRRVTASATLSQEGFQSRYGSKRIEEADRKEALGYRVGLNVAAAALCADTVVELLPIGAESWLKQVLRPCSNVVAFMGAGGLGVSLSLMRVNKKPLKRALQALFSTGLAAALYLVAAQQAQSLPEYVATHRNTVLAIAPLFAAFTGVIMNENSASGKPESATLSAAVPTLLLLHLSGLVPSSLEQGLLVSVAMLSGVFAARKHSQPIDNDIGDNSISEFMSLNQEKQDARIAELQIEDDYDDK